MEEIFLRRRLSMLFDEWLARHQKLEADVCAKRVPRTLRLRQCEVLAALLTDQFNALDALMADDPKRFAEAKTALFGHALFSAVFQDTAAFHDTRSSNWREPLPFGFRQMVHDRPEAGSPAYIELLNRKLLCLPLCTAMRHLGESLTRAIRSLPPDLDILAIGTSPAPEIASMTLEERRKHRIVIADRDAAALDHVTRQIPGTATALLAGNGAGCSAMAQRFDLIIAPFAYVGIDKPAFSADAPMAMCVAELFGQLKPGGRLLLGALMVTGNGNPHRMSHRMLLEGPGDTAPTYWTPAEMISFTDALAPKSFTARLLSEDLTTALDERTVIGVLEVKPTP